MRTKHIITAIIVLCVIPFRIMAQLPDDQNLSLSGSLLTDDRFLLNDDHSWAWNENRLTLTLDKRASGSSKFHSEVWLRNIGLPEIIESADLFNKGIVDPYNLEIREAYVQVNGFLLKNLDLTVGRQRISWGTADKLNPTDNLNPYDMEDILDFGRHRGSDAITLDYYLTNTLSVTGVFVPFFQPANMPVGIFSGALNPEMKLPQGMVLTSTSDTILMPEHTMGKSAVAGVRIKGFLAGIDLSASYVYALDGLPVNTRNTFYPLDDFGGTGIVSELSFSRTHIFGADMAASLAGIGLWAEGALFIPDKDVVMTNDFSAFYPMSPTPVTVDSLVLDSSDPYLKFIVGADYFFPGGSYINLQYMHGFIHERGNAVMNDYFFMQFYKTFFNDKLKIAPLGGAFIISDWKAIKDNYAYAYMPEITYHANVNTEIALSLFLFDGKGASLFAGMKDYNMFKLKVQYSF